MVFIALTLVTRIYLYSFFFSFESFRSIEGPARRHEWLLQRTTVECLFILVVFGHSRWPPGPSSGAGTYSGEHYYIWYSIIVSRDELVAINQEREHFCVAPQCDDSSTRGVTQNWQFWKRMSDHRALTCTFSKTKDEPSLPKRRAYFRNGRANVTGF